MDIGLIMMIAIPALAIVAAVVVQLRREARDRRLPSLYEGTPGASENLEGNVEARAAANGASFVRGGGFRPF